METNYTVLEQELRLEEASGLGTVSGPFITQLEVLLLNQCNVVCQELYN